MPTSIEDVPSSETAASGGLSSKLSALAIVVASIGTIAILFLFLTSRNDDIAAVQPVQATPDTVAESTSGTPTPRPPVAPTLPPPAAALPPPAAAAPAPAVEKSQIDNRGFVDSEARCDSGVSAVAIARTSRAAIVICRDRAGDHEYRGVRLIDGAFLQLDDVRPMAAGFEARNNDTTYRLSPTELVVLSGETLQSRDPMVEYQAH
ncbi:hypothetical protein [Mycobacterium sp. SMC-4]|uniref:hypothetical protein n=1 Tax=Mycobacterium sp. SMC-4 TaxID=2857059 RepID=UPI003D0825BF